MANTKGGMDRVLPEKRTDSFVAFLLTSVDLKRFEAYIASINGSKSVYMRNLLLDKLAEIDEEAKKNV